MRYFLLLFYLNASFLLTAQQRSEVDFKKIAGTITIIPKDKQVSGTVSYTFKVLQQTDSVFLDAKKMNAQLIKFSEENLKINTTENKIWFIHSFEAEKKYTLRIDFQVEPLQAMYFVGWNNEGENQVWTQGQGKYTSHWLPSIDDMNDKIEFDLTYAFPKEYTVIANGKLKEKEEKAQYNYWHYDMEQPMSSYLVAFAAGKFDKNMRLSKTKVPIELYYQPDDAERVEPTYRYSEEIFDFLEEEIGVDFPWQNYKQVPVRDFLYAGMENTTATIFSEQFVTDSIGFIDRNYVNVNAHELAHQWFGNLVTEVSSEHHWLHEGFATYYALLAERKIFGDDYYYYRLYESAERLKEMSDSGKGEALLNPKASSLTFYQKGAWALHILRERVGDEAFQKAVKNYLAEHKFDNVETSDFIDAVEKTSQTNLSDFVDEWLLQSAFKASEALASLKKSEFMQEYLAFAALRKTALTDKKEKLSRALASPVNEYLAQEAVTQLAKENPKEVLPLYQQAFKTNAILVRQAIATSLKKIPLALQKDYESLLSDPSYLTQEKALFSLWENFPKNRHHYLDQMKGIEGFGNKNVEMLWLTLNLVTQTYKPENKSATYQKLSAYTSPEYNYEIRENAFGFLFQINSFSAQNYKDLLQGCQHPVWRFKNFCRELLSELLTDATHRNNIKAIQQELPATEKKYLTQQLTH